MVCNMGRRGSGGCEEMCGPGVCKDIRLTSSQCGSATRRMDTFNSFTEYLMSSHGVELLPEDGPEHPHTAQ